MRQAEDEVARSVPGRQRQALEDPAEVRIRACSASGLPRVMTSIGVPSVNCQMFASNLAATTSRQGSPGRQSGTRPGAGVICGGVTRSNGTLECRIEYPWLRDYLYQTTSSADTRDALGQCTRTGAASHERAANLQCASAPVLGETSYTDAARYWTCGQRQSKTGSHHASASWAYPFEKTGLLHVRDSYGFPAGRRFQA